MELFVGAIIGLCTALYGVIFSKKIENINRIYDEFSEIVQEAADKSTCYWLLCGDSEEIKKLEAIIIGYQEKCTFMMQEVFLYSPETKSELLNLMAEFFDELSGGDFEVLQRRIDGERAKGVQVLAAKIRYRLLVTKNEKFIIFRRL